MRKNKKVLLSIIVFFTILVSGYQVFATNIPGAKIEFSEEYLEYLDYLEYLGGNNEKQTIAPRMYDIPKATSVIENPLKLVSMLGTSVEQPFSLRSCIPENMVVKNQSPTDTCWTFASLASLETNLALKKWKKQLPTIVYDFSEMHMDYATSRIFLDGTNEFGYNRVAGSSGVVGMPIAYLTNGLGAIAEEEMPFSTNREQIYLTDIQDKEVITQVNDIVTFPSYSPTDDLTQIKQQMKEHIKNYGAISASVHASSWTEGSRIYNSETAAVYCDSTSYKIDHSVAIVGWDDGYSVKKFVKGNRPQNNGAWIVKNSWGIEAGDEGYVYISYEDANIYKQLTGIVDAQTEISYDNIYQYDEFGGYLKFTANSSKLYLATEFDKKTAEEYLTQISINAPETYTCKVYVNPNGISKLESDLLPVLLKTGETETINAGYHTIEFAEPVKINADNFVVVLEIQGTRTDKISTLVEINYGEFYPSNPSAANHVYDYVTIADSKCFLATGAGFKANTWDDASKMYVTSKGKLPNFDTTIKAFTISKIFENISIETEPSRTTYIKGQDFDSTGMIVKANYSNGDSDEITDYSILNGEDLVLGQTSVTIVYEGKTVTQDIEVIENEIESISVKSPPVFNQYWAGEDFNDYGMVIEAVYLDKTTQIITDYRVIDGENLKNEQSTVTIEYEGHKATQTIDVQINSVEKLEITKEPITKEYVVGQNFISTGMVVKATYKNGLTKEVLDYTIHDGNNLNEGQTSVTIEYEEQTVKQPITILAKTVIGINIKTMPAKTQYIQNKEELNLTGGVIGISYNDGTTEEIPMTSDEISVQGFDDEESGTQTITLTYCGKSIQFEIEVKELPKPENSNFDNIQVSVNEIKSYYFTDVSKQEYITFNVEIKDFIKTTVNDELEHYYYLSSSPNEKNITDWIEIEQIQEADNQITFGINTLDISNYEELVNANTIYLYVKEIATRNDMLQEKITLPLDLKVKNIDIEQYVDGKKKADVNTGTITDFTPSEAPDNTTAPVIIPNAGMNIIVIIAVVAILIIGGIIYYGYNDIEIK